jgi:hypothetical protein
MGGASKQNMSKKNENVAMNKESVLGYPIGKVAQSIRKIISPTLTSHHVNCIIVVLVSHLMIEERLNSLIIKVAGK